MQGRYDEAAEKRALAFDAAPHCQGTIDGNAFNVIADADDRLGPILECFIRSQYMWVPFNCVRTIHIEAPEFLQNILWVRAAVTMTDGDELSIMLPARYPGRPDGSIAPDGLHLMGRATSFESFGDDEGVTIGIGQKLLATDTDDYPMLAVREIIFNHATAEAAD